MVGDFTERKCVSILIPGVEKTLKKIITAGKITLVDPLRDLALDTPSIMLHARLLDDFHLGNRPNPRKVGPRKISIECDGR